MDQVTQHPDGIQPLQQARTEAAQLTLQAPKLAELNPLLALFGQGAIAGHAQQVARVFGFAAPETISLSILPLCGVFGFNQTMATLAAGKPCVLVESYEIAEIDRKSVV